MDRIVARAQALTQEIYGYCSWIFKAKFLFLQKLNKDKGGGRGGFNLKHWNIQDPICKLNIFCLKLHDGNSSW